MRGDMFCNPLQLKKALLEDGMRGEGGEVG